MTTVSRPPVPLARQNAGLGLFVAGLLGCILYGSIAPGLDKLGPAMAAGFVIQILLFAVAILGAGLAIKGQLLGAVIDQRNRMSLSRLQMLFWTVLILSAMAAAVEWRLANGFHMRATDIVLPAELLAAMGIAAGSLVAAPAVLSLKPENSSQSVAVNAADETPSILDLVQGDEEGNRNTIDLSKLQQLAITLVLVGVYGSAVFNLFYNIDWREQAHIAALAKPTGFRLPELSRSFVELLAISHAGYLIYKAAPKPEMGGGASSGDSPRADTGSTEALG
jgi:hypothetical protein